MTNKIKKSLEAAPKRTVKKAKLAGIELPDNPPLSSDELLAHIRRRAYELFLQRNPAEGSAETDWLQAEREVLTTLGTPSTAPVKAKTPRAVRPRSTLTTGLKTTATPTRTRRKQPPAAPKS